MINALNANSENPGTNEMTHTNGRDSYRAHVSSRRVPIAEKRKICMLHLVDGVDDLKKVIGMILANT